MDLVIRTKQLWALCLATAGVGAVHAPAGSAQVRPAAVSTPPLVSGRARDNAPGITGGDALARTQLLVDHLEQIRRFMGRPPTPGSLVRARGVSMGEAYFNALAVRYRVQRLAFEVLRSELDWDPPPLPTREVIAADVFSLVDSALAVVLPVGIELGIEPPAEKAQPDTATPTELFNLLLTAAVMVDGLLAQKIEGANVFPLITILVHQGMAIHLDQTKRMMPEAPPFVPNQTSQAVFTELMACFQIITRLARSFDLPVLALERAADENRHATLNDLSALGVMMIAELDRMIGAMKLPKGEIISYAPSRKYPSHLLQRTLLLKAILEDIADARSVAKP